MSKFIVHSKSDTGKVRQKNEDSLYALSNDEYALLIVCDGMGGHEAGERASAIAKQSLIHSLSQKATNNQYPDLISQALKKADKRVLEDSIRSKNQSMGTTASVVLVRNNMLYVGWVGDSRVYLFRRDGEEYYQYLKTADHNHKTIAQRNAQDLPENEGNALIQAIGGGVEGVSPSTYKGFPFEQGDLVLVCSDGLTDMVSDQKIEQMIHQVPFDRLADSLVDAANRHGGEDNISVVLLGDYTTQNFVQDPHREEEKRKEEERIRQEERQREKERRLREKQIEEARIREEQRRAQERRRAQTQTTIPPEEGTHSKISEVNHQIQQKKSRKKSHPNHDERQKKERSPEPRKPKNANRTFALVVIFFGLIMAGLLMFLLSEPPKSELQIKLEQVTAERDKLQKENLTLQEEIRDLSDEIFDINGLILKDNLKDYRVKLKKDAIIDGFEEKRIEVILQIQNTLALNVSEACATKIIDCTGLQIKEEEEESSDTENKDTQDSASPEQEEVESPKDTAQKDTAQDDASESDTDRNNTANSHWKAKKDALNKLVEIFQSINMQDGITFQMEQVEEYETFVNNLDNKTKELEKIRGCQKRKELSSCEMATYAPEKEESRDPESTGLEYPKEMCVFLCYLVENKDQEQGE